MHYFTVGSLLCLMLPALVSATQYNIAKEWSGASFFDGWDFYGNYDNLTEGDTIFVNASEAANSKLAYVDSSTNHAIIKVDNTSTVPYNYKRNTVRITTQDRFTVGSVWVADMYHVPFGCSVWPAWWSWGPDWPAGGEIDTFEGVNQVTMNQMALHTEPGCTQVSPNQTSTLVNSTDCSYAANANQGCIVQTPTTASYGAGFASAGGGVFITEFAETGISIWFFSRPQVPSVLSSNSSTVDTSNFGTPVANWPTGGCNIDEFFAAQYLIFDITLCGEYAGVASVFNETCTGTCYDYVIGSPSNYDSAYFEISYVRVFSQLGKNTVIATSSTQGFSDARVLWSLAAGFVLALLGAFVL
jgi:hypothetical protein